MDGDLRNVRCRIDKNSSKRVFFRFISKDFLEQPEVSIKLTLNNTFGYFELDDMSKFTDTIDEIKWAKGSSGVRGHLTNPRPCRSPHVPNMGDVSLGDVVASLGRGKIHKM